MHDWIEAFQSQTYESDLLNWVCASSDLSLLYLLEIVPFDLFWLAKISEPSNLVTVYKLVWSQPMGEAGGMPCFGERLVL
jgi:hypothetical protein